MTISTLFFCFLGGLATGALVVFFYILNVWFRS